MAVIVGGVIKKDNKYLLVQEAKEKCYKKWNLPAGHLDNNEILTEAAKREIKEETGCDVEITGVCQIGNRKLESDIFVSLIFTTKLLKEEIKFDTSEILDVKWFTYEEIVSMKTDLRSPDLIITSIDNIRNGITAPINIVNLIR